MAHFHRVALAVRGDCVSMARTELCMKPRAPTDTLVAIDVDDQEKQAIEGAGRRIREKQISVKVPKQRAMRKRLMKLRLRAAPGPSGARNSNIMRLSELTSGLPLQRCRHSLKSKCVVDG